MKTPKPKTALEETETSELSQPPGLVKPICFMVDEHTVKHIREALECGLENTQAVLAEHETNLGRSTPKNKMWAEELERQIYHIRGVISELPPNKD